ncbi:hypothetical protein AB205_0212170 [Aquarana catesbeiana]|uniref:Uncharacterized protein n=1 Tax=Aquarana catesbeiana TaxID=8400 RepID=A0A2G9QJ47_AQUCT|nr:hypothetical protein AB205_0212170 [Aquarana catesbeiana]
MQPLCPSNAATVPINCSHCAHQTQPLCPSYAAIVPIICSHCAHQMQPLCPSFAVTVPIKCSHCAHRMQPLCPSIAAIPIVPIICSHLCPSYAATVPTAPPHSWGSRLWQHPKSPTPPRTAMTLTATSAPACVSESSAPLPKCQGSNRVACHFGQSGNRSDALPPDWQGGRLV